MQQRSQVHESVPKKINKMSTCYLTCRIQSKHYGQLFLQSVFHLANISCEQKKVATIPTCSRRFFSQAINFNQLRSFRTFAFATRHANKFTWWKTHFTTNVLILIPLMTLFIELGDKMSDMLPLNISLIHACSHYR